MNCVFMLLASGIFHSSCQTGHIFSLSPRIVRLPFLLEEEVVIGKMAVNLPSKCEKALKGPAQVLFTAIVKPPKGSFILKHSFYSNKTWVNGHNGVRLQTLYIKHKMLLDGASSNDLWTPLKMVNAGFVTSLPRYTFYSERGGIKPT